MISHKNLLKRYRDLEMNIMSSLREAINNSIIKSDHLNTKAIRVSIENYTELVIVNGSLTFLDENGIHYSIFSYCIEDLLNILIELNPEAKR